jgi:hypothetical protein
MGIWGGIIGGVIGSIGGPWGAAAGAAIGAALGEAFSKKKGEEGGDSNSGNTDFTIRAEHKFITIDETKERVEVFEVQIKGLVYAPKDNTAAECIIVARDSTGGKKFDDADIIATDSNSFSSFGNGMLSPKEEMNIPYECTQFSDWATVSIIPVDRFVFPYHGNREIEFGVLIQDKKNNGLAFATVKIPFQVKDIGYLELEQYWLKAEKTALLIVKFLVLNSSNYFTLETSKVITNWITERKQTRDDNNKDSIEELLKSECNQLKKTNTLPTNFSLESRARSLASNLRFSDRYLFMEFFLKVVSSFHRITNDDIVQLDIIAKNMKLDENEYQEQKHKLLPVHELDASDPFVMLGIPTEMPIQEKRRKIRELFNKWNSLAIHNNPEVRKKAEKMLNTIAECQRKLQQ